MDFKPEYLIPIQGWYLLRGIDGETAAIKHFVSFCYKKMNPRTERFQTYFDKEQTKGVFILQISESPLK